jgi:chemotaxis protein MotB
MKPGRVAWILLFTMGCVSQGQYDTLAQDRDRLQSKAREQQDRLDRDSVELARLRADVSGVETGRRECDQRLALALADGSRLQRELDSATVQNAQLGEELRRMGKNADQLLAERGVLSTTLADARSRLEELRKAQAAADARLALFRQLVQKFRKMIDAGELRVALRDGRMVLQLSNDVLFDTGKTEIKPAGQQALRQIAAVLSSMPERHFQVAGHTDDVPIKNLRFPSNWELSTGRAVEVVHLLIAQGLVPTSLSAAGYGEFDPIAPNGESEGRARNRRTEITLQPEIGEFVAVPGED